MLSKNKNVGMVSGLIPTRIICLFLSWHSRVIISWDDWLFFLQGKKVEFNLELLGYSNHYRIVLISLILVDLFYFGIALQSLTGKYREIQGKPCNQNREPAMRTGFPCNESRFFPVGIDLQGKAVSCTGFGFTVNPSLFDVTKATSSNFDKWE